MQRPIRAAVALAVAILIVFPAKASAVGSTSIVISEILTGTSTSAGQEFVELYNPTSEEVGLSDWRVEYKSATSANWIKKAELSGSIKPHSYYLIAPKQYYADSDAEWSSTLASAGGHVRLVAADGDVVDLVGYGTANSPETAAATAPATNQSLERLPGKTSEYDGNGIDTDDNSKDFVIRVNPEPQNSSSLIEPREVEGPLPQEPASVSYLPLLITELFVDPDSPLTDADDEFIEIFNPNDIEVNYGGYIIKGGTNFKSSYVLPSGTIATNSYVAFSSNQTHISLTNTGGSVQLLNPEGGLIDQSKDYGKAETGQSWSLVDGLWLWTTQPTKAAANVVALPAPTVTLASTKTTKPKATKAAPKPKAAAKPKTTAKSTKTTKPKADKKAKSDPLKVAAAQIKPASWLIIVLAVFTIGYAIYEFRYDISNNYHKLRRHLKNWRRPGSSS